MFKYTINCHNYDRTMGAVNLIRVIVIAPNETEARHAAAKLAKRQNYGVEVIEDVTDRKIAKIVAPLDFPHNRVTLPKPRKIRKIK